MLDKDRDGITEAANYLVKCLSTATLPFDRILENNKTITTEKEDLELLLTKAKKLLEEVCSTLPQKHAVPVMVQVHAFFYSDRIRPMLPAWAGGGLKTAMAVNSSCTENSYPRWTLDDLVYAVRLGGLVLYLESYRMFYNAFNQYFKPGELVYSPSGFVSTPMLKYLVDNASKCYEDMGRTLRTRDTTHRILLKNYKLALDAVAKIVSGVSPKDISLFKGTFFADIPYDCDCFWGEVFSRMLMLNICAMKSKPGRSDIALITNQELENSREILGGLLWNKAWYDSRVKEDRVQQMFVERPVLPAGTKYYFTSLLAVIDSLTWFVEEAVMLYRPGLVPEKVKQDHVTAKLEDEIINLCKFKGWMAGGVGDAGDWRCKEEPIRIPSIAEDGCGQIDVLASLPGKRIVLIADCKVPSVPQDASPMRTRAEQLGLMKKKYFRQLVKKANAIKNSKSTFPEHSRFLSAVIIDQSMPLIKREFNVWTKSELSLLLDWVNQTDEKSLSLLGERM